ncbi:MAG: RNA polymerase sigma-70 factor [Tannerellaceae bacterium]|jgi:RNA polymerase sigma-70 factor (ECF subfamily)|nr:RNA polymerase sigma-70 factor [Tannerellaceae bacterium]
MKDVELDALLLNIAVNDDRNAYQTLFEHSYAPLCLFAGRFVSDHAAREDIVQDVLFALWTRRKTLGLHVSTKGYLTKAVKNHCLNYLRKQGYHDEYLKDCLSNEQYAEADEFYNLRELYELLNRALSKLPEEYRLAFLLSRFKGRSTTEIAAMMQVSVRTVERYRERAISILRKELKDYLPLLIALFA